MSNEDIKKYLKILNESHQNQPHFDAKLQIEFGNVYYITLGTEEDKQEIPNPEDWYDYEKNILELYDHEPIDLSVGIKVTHFYGGDRNTMGGHPDTWNEPESPEVDFEYHLIGTNDPNYERFVALVDDNGEVLKIFDLEKSELYGENKTFNPYKIEFFVPCGKWVTNIQKFGEEVDEHVSVCLVDNKGDTFKYCNTHYVITVY